MGVFQGRSPPWIVDLKTFCGPVAKARVVLLTARATKAKPKIRAIEQATGVIVQQPKPNRLSPTIARL